MSVVKCQMLFALRTSDSVGATITCFTPAAYQRRSLQRILRYLVLGPVWRLYAFSASQLLA